MRLLSRTWSLTAAVTGLALLGGSLLQSSAARADSWCWDDPILTVQGQAFHVTVGVQGAQAVAQGKVRSADITVHVPVGATTLVTPSPAGPFPQTVKVVPDNGPLDPRGAVKVTVQVSFSLAVGTASLPAQMVITMPDGSKTTTTGTVTSPLSQNIVLQSVPGAGAAPGGTPQTGQHGDDQKGKQDDHKSDRHDKK